MIKAAIIEAANQASHGRFADLGKIYTATIGTVFLGTPHRGSGAETLGQSVATVAKLALKKPNSQLLATLATDSHILEQQRENFVTVSDRLEVMCFYETLPWSILGVETLVRILPNDFVHPHRFA